MRCEACQGSGMVQLVINPELPTQSFYHVICRECAGSGIAYCCDQAGINPPNSRSTDVQDEHKAPKE